MLLELQLAVDDEVLAAQRHERPRRWRRSRARPPRRCSPAPRSAAPPWCRSRGSRGRARILPPKSAVKATRLGATGLRDGVAERHVRRIEGHRVLQGRGPPWCRGTAPGRQRCAPSAPAPTAAIEIVRGAARHPAGRRPEADHRAIGAGPAQRAAMVRAVRQPDLAGRQRHRAAAGRAAAGERGVPGIARAAEHLVEGAAAGAELRRVGLGHHDAALALDALDQRDATWPARGWRRSASRRWCARPRRRSGP